MLDIKLIRTSPDQVKQALRDRQGPADEKIDEILKIDEQRRDLRSDTESKKAEQNRLSKQIPIMKKNKENTDELMKSLKNLSEEIKGQNTHLNELEQKQSDIILTLSNISHSSVPVGSDDGANVEVRKHGEPRKFDFEPKAHWDLGVDLDVIDAERAAKVSGSRFVFLKGLGARLERSIISFFMDNHSANGYTEVLPPYMVNRASMTGTGQLPKFEDDAFKVTNNGYFLIPTAEVPVTNLHRDEILMGDNLPVKYCAYSACFRAEIGSAGRDTRGIIGQHQFNKVELVKFAEPETSYNELELLTNDAERLLQILELPYRVVNLCTGDLGFSSAKTYDLEVWLPSYNRYMEISSCSNFEDFQARRAAIRYKKSIKDKTKLVHTLNGSGLAVGRTVAAIMENYQNEDGSITVPEALRSYMGTDVIK